MKWSAYFGRRVYLDANAVIYAFEQGYRWRNAVAAFLEALDQRMLAAVTSEITIAEVMVKPLQTSNAKALQTYDRFFSTYGGVEVVPINRHLILASARISASSGLKLIDALHVGTAELTGCDHLLTHDDKLGRSLLSRPTWLRFSDVET